MIMENSINGRWIIPFKKFGMVRVNLDLTGGVVKWLTGWTSNLRITSNIGSNPVKGKLLFP